MINFSLAGVLSWNAGQRELMTMGIPNILFDSKSSQLEVQVQTGTRLTNLYHAIQKRGWQSSTTLLPASGGDAPLLTIGLLNNYNVLCILTRLDQKAPPSPSLGPYPEGSNPPPFFRIFEQNSIQYWPEEITAILNFVYNGGGLLLISDHGPPSQKEIMDNQTINDCQLAAAFGVAIEPAMFVNPNGLIVMSGSCLNSAFSANILDNVTSIVVHDCCAIFPFDQGAGFVPVVSLPDGLNNVSPINNVPPADANGNTLAYALCNPNYGSGKVIIAGNAGIAGNSDHPYPSQGLFYTSPPSVQLMPYTSPPSYLPTAQNDVFLLNCLEYLAP
jgi:hypothetical protein